MSLAGGNTLAVPTAVSGVLDEPLVLARRCPKFLNRRNLDVEECAGIGHSCFKCPGIARSRPFKPAPHQLEKISSASKLFPD